VATPVPERFARTESSAWHQARPAAGHAAAGHGAAGSVSSAGPGLPAEFDTTLIKGSFARASADQALMMELFFARLFAANPEIRVLFPLAMTATRHAVYDALARLIQVIDEPADCQQLLGQLARDHRKFGVKEKHYRPFFDALLATVEQLAARAWTPQTAAAWQAALDHFAAVIRDAAAQDAISQPAWWVGEIVRHDLRTPTIAVLTIRPDKPLRYLPGQYVPVQVPRWPRVWRSYSIANAPRENGLLDIHVRAMPGGVISTALAGHCRPGDTLVLGAARGDMVVSAGSQRDLVCVAGGTGLAPVKAIIESVVCAASQGRRRNISLYLGVRQPDDLYDMRDLSTLALAYPSLTLIPVVGHQAGGPAGGLLDVVAAHPSFRDTDVYLSGPYGMVASTARALSRRVPAGRLHHDPLPALAAASRSAGTRVSDRPGPR
jgi:NAD(P)H-flavin reductase/hemoglobin-like flavoprotein